MENSKNTIPPTSEIPLEEVAIHDTPKDKKRINIIVNEIEKIEERLTSMEEETADIVDEVKRTDEISAKVPAKKRNFVVIFPEEAVDALSTSDILPDYMTAYPHLDELLTEQGENGRKKEKTGKPFCTRCTKTLTGALCFWRTMCLILAVTIVILIILTRQPVRNVYYTYQ